MKPEHRLWAALLNGGSTNVWCGRLEGASPALAPDTIRCDPDGSPSVEMDGGARAGRFAQMSSIGSGSALRDTHKQKTPQNAQVGGAGGSLGFLFCKSNLTNIGAQRYNISAQILKVSSFSAARWGQTPNISRNETNSIMARMCSSQGSGHYQPTTHPLERIKQVGHPSVGQFLSVKRRTSKGRTQGSPYMPLPYGPTSSDHGRFTGH